MRGSVGARLAGGLLHLPLLGQLLESVVGRRARRRLWNGASNERERSNKTSGCVSVVRASELGAPRRRRTRARPRSCTSSAASATTSHPSFACWVAMSATITQPAASASASAASSGDIGAASGCCSGRAEVVSAGSARRRRQWRCPPGVATAAAGGWRAQERLHQVEQVAVLAWRATCASRGSASLLFSDRRTQPWRRRDDRVRRRPAWRRGPGESERQGQARRSSE